jgi:cytidylate kinase
LLVEVCSEAFQLAARIFGGLAAGGGAAAVYSYCDAPAKIPNIIISGGPASGKGTQCELIVAKYGCKHISTGDALRHHVKLGTDLGKEAKGFMDAGDLVPDALVIGICKAEMDTAEAKKAGWLLDGMPRTKARAFRRVEPAAIFLRER